MSEFKLKDGRYTVRIRKHLRAFVAAKEQPAVYINDLIEKDQQKPPHYPHALEKLGHTELRKPTKVEESKNE